MRLSYTTYLQKIDLEDFNALNYVTEYELAILIFQFKLQ